jgi:hypothetical protein
MSPPISPKAGGEVYDLGHQEMAVLSAAVLSGVIEGVKAAQRR